MSVTKSWRVWRSSHDAFALGTVSERVTPPLNRPGTDHDCLEHRPRRRPGTHVLVTTAVHLRLDLGGQESTRALARRLNHYATRGLLVSDEIGYLSYDARAADLLFQVVSR